MTFGWKTSKQPDEAYLLGTIYSHTNDQNTNNAFSGVGNL